MAIGKKTGGGSRKGIPNKATAKREAEIANSGLTPLDYMLGVLRDSRSDKEDKHWAAQNAAPYVHPKLATVQLGGDKNAPLVIQVVKFGDSPASE